MPDERLGGPPPVADDERYELIGRIAGAVAHDLNNALSTVTTFADLLLARCGPGSSMAEDLVEIKEAGVAAARTLRRLQLFARPGRHAPEVLDLALVARSVEPLLARLLGPAFRLGVRAVEPVPPICAATSHVEEVLLALAGWIRRSMPRGGEVTLVVASEREAPGSAHPRAAIETVVRADRGGFAGEDSSLLETLVSELGGAVETSPVEDGSILIRLTLPRPSDG